MTREDVLQELRERFRDEIVDIFDKSPQRVYVEIKPEAIVPVGTHIFRDLGARFNIASGVDTRTHIEILYHFIVEDLNLLISVRVKLPRENPVIQSLGARIPAVDWIEREMAEMLGITFEGHPDMRRLLLSADWPEGVYPLRRDYKEWDAAAIRDRGV